MDIRKKYFFGELVSDYLKKQDKKTLEQIVLKAQPILKNLAKKYCYRYYDDYEDCLSEANIALLESIKTYKPERGITFETYLWKKAVWAIKTYKMKQWLIKRADRKRRYLLQYAEMQKKINCMNPTFEEYLEEWERIGFSRKTFNSFYNFCLFSRRNHLEFDEDIFNKAENTEEPSKRLEHKEVIEVFCRELLDIKEEYREFFIKWIFENMSVGDAAKETGLSASRGSQIKREYLDSKNFFRRTREYISN